MRKKAAIAATLILTVVSCGGSQGTRPDEMSAEGHRRAAARDERAAAAHQAQYDPNARVVTQTTPLVSEVYWGPEVYNPSEVHAADARAHRALAGQHRAAAQALEAFEEAECARFPAQTRAACPLLGQVTGIEDIPSGVRLVLADGVSREAIADHMRCHVAFARSHGREGMDRCPLYLEGVDVALDEQGVSLVVSDASKLDDLRMRARAHVTR